VALVVLIGMIGFPRGLYSQVILLRFSMNYSFENRLVPSRILFWSHVITKIQNGGQNDPFSAIKVTRKMFFSSLVCFPDNLVSENSIPVTILNFKQTVTKWRPFDDVRRRDFWRSLTFFLFILGHMFVWRAHINMIVFYRYTEFQFRISITWPIEMTS